MKDMDYEESTRILKDAFPMKTLIYLSCSLSVKFCLFFCIFSFRVQSWCLSVCVCVLGQ